MQTLQGFETGSTVFVFFTRNIDLVGQNMKTTNGDIGLKSQGKSLLV